MTNQTDQLQWTDEQWQRVRDVVYEEARKARVAGTFLPLYGPLPADRITVPGPVVKAAGGPSPLEVDDAGTLRIATLQVKVKLRGAQVADPELESALLAFRRAANQLARIEDAIVMLGQSGTDKGPTAWPLPPASEVRGGQENDGLGRVGTAIAVGSGPDRGNHIVTWVSAAIGKLESLAHQGPFACVLGQDSFTAVQTPNPASLVLPQDRILPFLGGGPLLRSSVLAPDGGFLVALGGAPVDLVVATDTTVGFLQVTEEPGYLFRVYEKIVLRIKESDAIVRMG